MVEPSSASPRATSSQGRRVVSVALGVTRHGKRTVEDELAKIADEHHFDGGHAPLGKPLGATVGDAEAEEAEQREPMRAVACIRSA